jgi:hypothetical protein
MLDIRKQRLVLTKILKLKYLSFNFQMNMRLNSTLDSLCWL